MNETAEGEFTETAPTEPPSETAEETPAFPWPPAAESSVFRAFTDTLEQSLRTPAEFFRAMPARGYGSALSYFLIIGILAAGARLFWSNIFELAGYAPLAESMRLSSPDAADRLIGFLLQPLVLIGILSAVSLITHAGLHIVGAARAPFVTTMRAFSFSYGPQLAVAVPFIGWIVALTATLVLFTIALREVHQASTRRVLLALALPFGVLLLLLIAGLLLFVLLMIGAVVMRIPL